MAQNINCSFSNYTLFRNQEFYTCVLTDLTIDKDKEIELYGDHTFGRSQFNVSAVFLSNCQVSTIPQRLTKFFPNLIALCIEASALTTIQRRDLKEYSKLKILNVIGNEIEFLASDVFADTPNLEVISFNMNKLQLIEPGIFDGLKQLRYLNLLDNNCIHRCFDLANRDHSTSLSKIRREIKQNFSTWVEQKLRKEKILLHEIDELRLQHGELERKNLNLTETIESLRVQQKRAAEHENTLFNDLKRTMMCEDMKDLTIHVDGSQLKAHKLVLIARSQFFAELFKSNLNAHNLVLENITLAIFVPILSFIYTNELPAVADDDTLMEMFNAAAKYKIVTLRDYLGDELLSKINSGNALKMLSMANKHEFEELQRKSFEEVKKLFPNKLLNDKMARCPEKLEQALNIKKTADFQFNALLLSKPEEKVEFDRKGYVKTERKVQRVKPYIRRT